MAAKPVHPGGVPPVPIEYSGKWIAWSRDHSQIVACSDRFENLWQFVLDQQIEDPIFEKVPHSDVRLVGRR
jgi:hypothetical protein